jgi:hypothetical protein
MKYKGPFQIIKTLGKWTYQLINQRTAENVERSHYHLKKVSENLEIKRSELESLNDARTACAEKNVTLKGRSLKTERKEVTHSLHGQKERTDSLKRRILPPNRYGFQPEK